MQSGTLGPYAGALIEIGRYREALAALQKGEVISRKLLAADPKNIRAVQDPQAGLSREAECYQDPAAGLFPGTRKQSSSGRCQCFEGYVGATVSAGTDSASRAT